MVKLWRRYKPFINAGVQELITYRVNFILYRIGDVMGAFVAFYLCWTTIFKCHCFDENLIWARDCRSA
ncbi:MAG: hypothetical protein E7I87_08090, partial [Streptococcus mitis]|nr:hypothetical protein [Streptococcus mitis]